MQWNTAKPYVIQTSLFLLMLGIGWFGVGWLMREIQTKKDHIQELGVLTENRQRQMSRLPDLDKQYEFILENEDTLDIVLSKERIVELIRTLEDIARDTGVVIEITSRDNTLLESKITLPSSVTKAKDAPVTVSSEDASQPKKAVKKETGILTELPLAPYIRLTVAVIGQYPAIAEYLHKMETLPIALDVVSLQMKERIQVDKPATEESGINPFNPDGTLAPAAPVVRPDDFLLQADFDTVIYLKNL